VPVEFCRPGTGVTGSTFGCAACQPGTVKADNTSVSTCSSCPKGYFAGDAGLTNCEMCPPGTYASSTGSGRCTPCPGGSFSNSSGSHACTLCPPGSATLEEGSTNCSLCPPGQKISVPGQQVCERCSEFAYASGYGTVQCQVCPSGSTSSDSQGVSCRCDDKSFMTSNQTCETCPTGGICEKGILQGVGEGFWRSLESRDTVYKCPMPAACTEARSLKEQCESGHTGPVCAQCEDNWYIGATGKCTECGTDQTTTFWMVLFIVALVVGLIVASWRFTIQIRKAIVEGVTDEDKIRKNRDDDGTGVNNVTSTSSSSKSSSGGSSMNWKNAIDPSKLRVLVGFLQVFTSLGTTFDVPWPGSFVEFMERFEASFWF
jgi:Tyrosine-protein kinase ephrin type A/B receptor-like